MAPEPQPDHRLSGLDELKAVAHPLRIQMLGALREHGPATATELAKRFETDTGSTSYHLRKLADAGFVTEVEDPGGHHRSRRWAATRPLTSYSNAEMAKTAEGREIVSFFHGRQMAGLADDIARYEATLNELPLEWAEAFGVSDLFYKLTARSLSQLWETMYAELERLSEQDATDPDARPMGIFLAGLPR